MLTSPVRTHAWSAPSTIWPVYSLQASQALPQIDCAKTIKTVIFSPRGLARCNYFIWRWKRLINLSLLVGIIVTWMVPFFALTTCRVLAVTAFATLLVPVTTAFLVMRYDIVSLLVSTYEFWYIAVNTVLSSVLLVLYMRDVERALLCFVTFLCYLYTVLVDARYSDLRSTTIAVASGALSVASMMVAVAFEALPGTTDVVLFKVKGTVLHATDVILNSLGIVFVLFVRSAYRRYTLRSTTCGVRVRVFSYRVRVKFQVCDRPHHAATPLPGQAVVVRAAAPARLDRQATERLSQLESVPQVTLFDSRGLLCWPVVDWVTRLIPPHLLRLCGYTMVLLCALTPLLAWYQLWVHRLQFVLMVMTTLYCGACCAAHNRAMLGLLLKSFDLIFLLVNASCAHAAVVYLVGWNSRSAIVVTSWWWAYWVITIDALTPNMRAALGVSRQLVAVVLLYLIAAQVAVCTELVFQINSAIHDRVIVSFGFTSQHRVVITAIPFLFTRIFSVFWWTWRLLWRVCTQQTTELILIQGATEYEDYQLRRRIAKRKQPSANPVQVQPATLTSRVR